MPHLIDELRSDAERAIAAMQEAARAARAAHARAELMRHMLTTARKMEDRPRDEAVGSVVGEWMAAWGLDHAQDLAVAQEMRAYAGAVRDYVREPRDDADAALRGATQALEQALEARGTTLANEMAWRSQCAHGWWEAVTPTPSDLRGSKPRPIMPRIEPGRPFWETGCAEHCR